MNKAALMNKLIILLTVTTGLCPVCGVPKIDDSKGGGKLAPYEILIRRLEEKNHHLQNSLRQRIRPTLNEMDDFEYYMMDERAVQRAWSRDLLTKHEDHMNTRFVKLATDNLQLVLKTAQCHYPTRRCLDVNKMEIGKTKSYWPNCALVHKCGHDSGCCKHPDNVCTAVETENIDLYFFSIQENKDKKTGRVERLTFENHTRCDCRPMPQNLVFHKSYSTCECPKDFTPVPNSLECRCDCNKRQSKTCKRIKKGRRSYYSRGCKGKCGPPACDYGEFKTKFGRCPRKNDKGGRRK